MTYDRYHLLFLSTRNILFCAFLSFGLLLEPHPFLLCVRSVVLTFSCTFVRIIISEHISMANCNDETSSLGFHLVD
jgi:hypothetical protein